MFECYHGLRRIFKDEIQKVAEEIPFTWEGCRALGGFLEGGMSPALVFKVEACKTNTVPRVGMKFWVERQAPFKIREALVRRG